MHPHGHVAAGFLGLRYPVKLLLLLLFESAWKPLWILLIVLPRTGAGDLDEATTATRGPCTRLLSAGGDTVEPGRERSVKIRGPRVQNA